VLSDATFYSAIAPAIAPAGKFDRDSEIRIFTDVPALGQLSMDLRKGKANTEQIWRVLQAKFLP
jgi:hypothetical protein